MQLTNEFVVPRGIDETWAVLTDVERIAPAMPGAELTGVEDGKYNGKVKVKVGPVTAAYAGVASFREQDPVNHHMVLDATGKESSGRGRAAAIVTADLVAEGAETRVKVVTDLTISGPLAQFGRGAIAEVSTRLLNQFVANLKEMVLADEPQPDAGAPQATGTTPAGAASAAASVTGAPAATAPAASAPAANGQVAGEGATGHPDTVTAPPSGPAATEAVVPLDTAGPAPGGSSGVNGAAPAGLAAPAMAVPPPAAPSVPGPDAPATRAGAVPPAPGRPAQAPAAEVNLLKVAAWPILKRVIPLIIVVAVIIIVIVWLA